MYRRTRVIASRKFHQIVTQWSAEGHQHAPPRFCSKEPYFARRHVHGAPAQSCDVAEPLPSVESEKNQAPPFSVTRHFQHREQFRDRKATPALSITLLASERLHSRSDVMLH